MVINIGNEQHNDLCVGIDLGTTNSVLATINVKLNGDIVSKVVGIDRAIDMFGRDFKFTTRRDLTLPSCVYYNEEKNFAPIVGNFAKSRYSIRPHLVAKSIKSQMGNVKADGLDPNIPDKTPAAISARILRHMLQSAAKTSRQDSITDAVITVPASFDSVMCQATLEAARLAGINIYNRDGSLREILLPEPQAVIYDFVNQVHNGEISTNILDLSAERNVMVFDLGGGTLDITLHKISRREDAPEILNVEDLAINRYTLLGGDDFDLLLANAMFMRYLDQYHTHADIVQLIRREESAVKPQLLSHAEELKIQVSEDKSGNSGENADAWGDDEDNYPVGGNINATGYAYDDSFTTQELEKIWRVFMGEEFKFADFKNLDAVAKNYGTQNIIFPILDVLKKCADKLGTDDFKIDAVIMNGGMSRFYMVVDRLRRFFGFEPIVALDPDQAVARGAAVYHYFRHKYEEKIAANNFSQVEIAPVQTPYINTVQTILPDSLYLVTQGNRYEEIIPTGTKLPYESGIFTGFKLPAKTNKISIPIARKNNDGDYIVIAKGNLNFPEKYSSYETETFVVFTVNMNEQKILRINTHTCKNVDGSEILDEGTTEIAIADKHSPSPISKPQIETTRIKLKANEVINNILGNCKKIASAQKRGSPISNYSKNIRYEKNQIFNAANPEDFAEPLLQMFRDNGSNEIFKMHCEIIGRKICAKWTDAQRRRLANLCMDQLEYAMTFHGALLTGAAVNTKIQAIYTLSMCGSDEDLDRLRSLHDYKQFKLANLYTHAITKTCVEWIYEEFQQDSHLALKNIKNHLQQSAHALGTAFRLNDERPNYSSINKGKIVTELLKLLRSKKLLISEFISCVLAIGLLCDRRYPNPLEQKYIDNAQQTFNELGVMYDKNFIGKADKFKLTVQKMMEGVQLSVEEEEFLLIKLDD